VDVEVAWSMWLGKGAALGGTPPLRRGRKHTLFVMPENLAGFWEMSAQLIGDYV